LKGVRQFKTIGIYCGGKTDYSDGSSRSDTRNDKGLVHRSRCLVKYMLPSDSLIVIREYQDRADHSPFRDWFDGLNSEAARKVTKANYRVGLGNFSSVKSVGAGVHECRINFGPGYRVYFGKDGDRIVMLLGGGTKQRQQRDIRLALDRWEDYKQRKKLGKDGGSKWR
jgi:putative addiction module killer protein